MPKRLMKALEMNYRAYRHRECRRAGGEVCSRGGLSWTRQENKTELLFPRLPAGKADAELCRFMRDQIHGRSSEVEATVGTECTPRGIIAHLNSVGFEIPPGGGIPGMAARIWKIPNRAPPEGIILQPTLDSESTFRLEARARQSFVGTVLVECASGVAGMYDLRVESRFRLRGIGSRLMEGAMRWARGRGLKIAVLAANPLAASLYARLGFGEVGRIWYCSLAKAALSSKPMNSRQRRMVVASYMGRLSELMKIAKSESFRFTTPAGLNLMQVAASKRQIGVGRWLLKRGLKMDPLSAWDLGLGDRLPDVCAIDRGAIDRKISGMTPLHQAVLRRDTNVDNDLSLIKALLKAGADTTITDDEFNATPLAWAKVFGDAEAEELLSGAGAINDA